MRRFLPLKIALTSLMFAACVTINVYFPAAAAEKLAEDYVKDVTGGGSSTTPPQSRVVPAPEGGSATMLVSALGSVLFAVVPAANAQPAAEALNATSPAIARIKASQQARFGELRKFYDSGAIGITKDGMLAVRELSAVALGDRATLTRLVKEENSDREQLYVEIAKANNQPSWEADLKKIFAKEWVRSGAQPGWYYQDDSGAWKQK
jgi:uncharacterized protein